MDPRIEFGRPVLKSSAVPTAVIADRYKAGESIADLAEDYGEETRSACMTICFRTVRKTSYGCAMRELTGGWCSRATIGPATTARKGSGSRRQGPTQPKSSCANGPPNAGRGRRYTDHTGSRPAGAMRRRRRSLSTVFRIGRRCSRISPVFGCTYQGKGLSPSATIDARVSAPTSRIQGALSQAT
jgi:hypothetical protein